MTWEATNMQQLLLTWEQHTTNHWQRSLHTKTHFLLYPTGVQRLFITAWWRGFLLLGIHLNFSFFHFHSHFAQKYHETQWGYPLKTGRDMDFLPSKRKVSTSKDNSANSWGTLQNTSSKAMIKALTSEAQHWRGGPGIKYEMCLERKPDGKVRFRYKLQPKLLYSRLRLKNSTSDYLYSWRNAFDFIKIKKGKSWIERSVQHNPWRNFTDTKQRFHEFIQPFQLVICNLLRDKCQ